MENCYYFSENFFQDVHNRYRTESHAEIVARFNERFILSLSSCKACAVMDDQLNILPISSHIAKIEPLPTDLKVGNGFKK
jgi:tRNA(Met) C34 N-acetyltransferase TmcA